MSLAPVRQHRGLAYLRDYVVKSCKIPVARWGDIMYNLYMEIFRRPRPQEKS